MRHLWEIGGVYNLASGVETTIKRLAEVIIQETSSVSIEMLPARDWDWSGRCFGSTENLRLNLILASTSLEEGIQRTVEWTKKILND